jgi:hypothetical protein
MAAKRTKLGKWPGMPTVPVPATHPKAKGIAQTLPPKRGAGRRGR